MLTVLTFEGIMAKKKTKKKPKALKGHVKSLGNATKALELATRELKKTHKSHLALCQDAKIVPN